MFKMFSKEFHPKETPSPIRDAGGRTPLHAAAAGGAVEGDFEGALRRVLDAVGSRLA